MFKSSIYPGNMINPILIRPLINARHLQHLRSADGFLLSSSQRMNTTSSDLKSSSSFELMYLFDFLSSAIPDRKRRDLILFSSEMSVRSSLNIPLYLSNQLLNVWSASESWWSLQICKTRLSGRNLGMELSKWAGFQFRRFVNYSTGFEKFSYCYSMHNFSKIPLLYEILLVLFENLLRFICFREHCLHQFS